MEQTLRETREGEGVSVFTTLLLLGVSTLSLLLFYLRRSRPKLNLPPCPFYPLPLLGHLPHLRRLRDLSFRYSLHTIGPIFTLHAGNFPIIFITSAALAHEALVQKSLLFAARPQLPSRAFFSNNFRSISTASYGPYWRAMRRNLVHEMLASPKIVSFKAARARTLDRMISGMLAEAQQNEGMVSVFNNIRTAVLELLLFMCFGFHMPEEHVSQIIALFDEMFQLPRAFVQDFYPFLRFFDGKRLRRVRTVRAKEVRLFSSHIEKHRELRKVGEIDPGSYVETLLHMDASNPLSADDLVTLCTEFLVGGTDTTVTTLEWAMARLVENPSIQDKLNDQIHGVVGDRLPDEEDLPHLPYLHAVTKETLRLHPPGDFVLPHGVSELCRVGGYDIPPNAIVHFHVASISRDPNIWEEPLTFKPDRFLTSDIDITGSKEVTMMPFGVGRRICPGLGLASIHLDLFVARMVQAFQWSSLPSGVSLDLTEKLVFTIRMKHPLRALVKERRVFK